MFLVTLLLFLGPIRGYGQAADLNIFNWEQLPDLPAPEKGMEQSGLAGAFSGIHNDALIVAGGANFPNGMPWEGGEKVWWDEIYVLEKKGEGNYLWRVREERLPRPLAYGVSISTEDGIICIGGNNSEGVYREVFRLQWDPATQKITVETLPPLPHPLAFMTGSRVGNRIYIAGGMEESDGKSTKHFWVLDLDKMNGDENAWKELPPWPGPARVLAVSAGQSNGQNDAFYLFSGRKVNPGQKTQILNDAYSYDPFYETWTQLGPIEIDGQAKAVMAAPAIASGANHILIFGGADGGLFTELELLKNKIRSSDNPGEIAALKDKETEILETHLGFSRNVLAYHTITDTWSEIDSMPFVAPVTTKALRWNESVVIPGGEIKPGVRTPGILKAEPRRRENTFGWLNYSVVGAYLVLLVGMGIYFSRRENTTDDYFKAGGRIPWWAAGLSIFGTQLSAITFMAIPAKAYATDWSYFMFNMTIVIVAPIIVFMFLPFFRRLNVTTAYEYLEKRFNVAARLIGSLMFMALQFGRIGIVLFLPSLALSVSTGIDVTTCILVMGILSIIYTVLGGIEAVIWTDVVQVAVLLGGALLCLVIIPFDIQGGISHIIDTITVRDKINIFNFDVDLTTPTFWVVLIGGLAANLISYGSDQAVVQRYLTTSDEKNAARGIWTNALLTIPAALLFFSVGTALFVFYQDNPQMLDTSATNSDAIFPLFIVTQLPSGVAGILIAGIFAAAMSSLDSSMNSVASVITTDFYQRFTPQASEHNSLKVAKWTTGIIGASGTAFALVMAGWDIKSLWDQLNTFIGLFAGGLGGLFILGIFTRRTSGVGAVSGLVASGIIQYLVKAYTSLHLLLYTFTGMASCIIVGYVISILFQKSAKEAEGLTIYTLKSKLVKV